MRRGRGAGRGRRSESLHRFFFSIGSDLVLALPLWELPRYRTSCERPARAVSRFGESRSRGENEGTGSDQSVRLKLSSDKGKKK